jgi:predicted RNA-binding Zn-ribbon protein involved in translation (DUF1610 family)
VWSIARTASKPKQCDGCYRQIVPGERYVEHRAAPGGELGYDHWVALRECARCTQHTPRAGMTDPLRCDDCGRTGYRGFTVRALTADEATGMGVSQTWTICTGRTSCRRRQYRALPAEARARRRIADEVMYG